MTASSSTPKPPDIQRWRLAEVCDEFGMPPAPSDVHPMNSKRTYVKSRLKGLDDSAMLVVARRVLKELADESLAAIVAEGVALAASLLTRIDL